MPTRSHVRVLIVDDDADQLQILSEALGKKYVVLCASDGLEGYAMACVEQPGIVILDLMMPLVDGWTVLRKLRTNPRTKDTRVIVVTALDHTPIRGDLARLHVSRVLSKPVNLRDLETAISQAEK